MAGTCGQIRQAAAGAISCRAAARCACPSIGAPARSAARRRTDRRRGRGRGTAAHRHLPADDAIGNDGPGRYPRCRLCRAVRASAPSPGCRHPVPGEYRTVTVAGWPAAAGALPIARDPVRWSLAAIAAVMAYLAALGGIGLIALGDARRDW